MLYPGLYEQVINTKLESELAEIPQARKAAAFGKDNFITSGDKSRMLDAYAACVFISPEICDPRSGY